MAFHHRIPVVFHIFRSLPCLHVLACVGTISGYTDPMQEFITKEKLEELKVELEELKVAKRREVAEKLEAARALGDLSENAEYHNARDEQAEIEDRIKHLEQVVKNAKVVAHTRKTDDVRVGSTVEIKKKGERTTSTYTIVGSEESNIHEGKISFHAPLGEALLGKEKGSEVSFETPNGIQTYVIVEVR